nr:Rac-like GTP-binding protein 7 [Tanacetum cinerariifolium]
MWSTLGRMIKDAAKETLGVTIGSSKTHTAPRESMWLSEEVQSKVAAKKASLSTLHFLKLLENKLESMKILENKLQSLKLVENKLESMMILENKLESLNLQENQSVEGLIPLSIKKFTSESVLPRLLKS